MQIHRTLNGPDAKPPIAILGVLFDNVTMPEAIGAIERMVASRQPHYLVTANVDFVVQAQEDVELRRILFDAHLVLCDGTPLVWASKLLGNRLVERVAGADLVPQLLGVAAEKAPARPTPHHRKPGARTVYRGRAREPTATVHWPQVLGGGREEGFREL